jgi:phosphoglycerate dehydrogenase-like enzyme
MTAAQEQRLRTAAQGHELLAGTGAAPHDLARADVAFGQPPIQAVIESPRLRWLQLSSAGYGGYDTAELRAALSRRGAALTKSSFVYAAPCAEHVLAFMLAWARQLPQALRVQVGERSWPQGDLRRRSALLRDQNVLIFGFGSIGAQLALLLAPFALRCTGVRRDVRGDEGIPMLRFDDASLGAALGSADHIVNVMPGAPATARYFNRERLSQIKPGAVFYNVGRGSTVDQPALIECLTSGRLAAALLDVTDPEPLPPEHPLWAAPNCFITPHTAGGHHDEGDRLVGHFIMNLERFEQGQALLDRAF